VVEHAHSGAVAPRRVFCPNGRARLLDGSLRRPFVIFPATLLLTDLI
jgi:hypothetical protein